MWTTPTHVLFTKKKKKIFACIFLNTFHVPDIHVVQYIPPNSNLESIYVYAVNARMCGKTCFPNIFARAKHILNLFLDGMK